MYKIIILLILLIIAGCSIPKSKDIEILEAVPQNTSLVIRVNDTIDLDSSPLLLKIFDLNPDIRKTIKNITPQKPLLPFLYCITPIGKNENAIGFISKSNAADTLITYETEIKYSDQIIGTIKERGQRFYMAQFGKLKMISESQLIIENGIRNYKRKNRGIMSPEFFQLAKTMDQNLAINFFIHPSSKSLFKTLFPSTPLFPKTGNQWLALD